MPLVCPTNSNFDAENDFWNSFRISSTFDVDPQTQLSNPNQKHFCNALFSFLLRLLFLLFPKLIFLSNSRPLGWLVVAIILKDFLNLLVRPLSWFLNSSEFELTTIFNLSLSFSTNFHTTWATMEQLWRVWKRPNVCQLHIFKTLKRMSNFLSTPRIPQKF